MFSFRAAALTGAVLLAVTIPCRADLIGTPVTGSLTFGTTTNYYDPSILGGWYVNGPADLNTGGTTVAISATAAEFGYADGASTISANFTGTQLTLTETSTGPAGWTQTFTDPAFAGLSLVSSSFTGLSYSSSGDTLTFIWGGSPSTSVTTTYSATFNIVDPAVPEASAAGFLMIGMGLVVLLLVKRNRARLHAPGSNP